MTDPLDHSLIEIDHSYCLQLPDVDAAQPQSVVVQHLADDHLLSRGHHQLMDDELTYQKRLTTCFQDRSDPWETTQFEELGVELAHHDGMSSEALAAASSETATQQELIESLLHTHYSHSTTHTDFCADQDCPRALSTADAAGSVDLQQKSRNARRRAKLRARQKEEKLKLKASEGLTMSESGTEQVVEAVSCGIGQAVFASLDEYRLHEATDECAEHGHGPGHQRTICGHGFDDFEQQMGHGTVEHACLKPSALDDIDDKSVEQSSMDKHSVDAVTSSPLPGGTLQSGLSASSEQGHGNQSDSVEARPACELGQNVITVNHPVEVASELGRPLASDFSCEVCDISFASDERLLRHNKDEHGVYYCKPCGKTFKDQVGWLQHMNMKHGAAVCLPCCKMFPKKAGLAAHNVQAHVVSQETPSASSTDVSSADEADESLAKALALTSSTTCSDSSHAFSSVTQLQEHVAFHPDCQEVPSMGWFSCFICGAECGSVDKHPNGTLCPLCHRKSGHSLLALSIAQQQAGNCVAQPLVSAPGGQQVSGGTAAVTQQKEPQPMALSHLAQAECRQELSNKKALLAHSKDKHDEQACLECEKKFPHRRALLQHINMKHGQSVCLPCECLFQEERDLHQHNVLEHTVPPEEKEEAEAVELSEETQICLHCGKKVTTKLGLFMHQNTKHGLHFCLPCEKVFKSKKSMLQHMSMKHNAPVCFICEVKLSDPTALLEHMDTAHGESTDAPSAAWQTSSAKATAPVRLALHCDLCDRDFPNEDALFQHERAKHPPVYSCDLSEQDYGSQYALDAHNRDKHAGIFQPQDRNFPYKDGLPQHNQQQHSYSCSICPKDFDVYLGYYNHMKDKHQIVAPSVTEAAPDNITAYQSGGAVSLAESLSGHGSAPTSSSCSDALEHSLNASNGRTSKDSALQESDIPCLLCGEICTGGLGSFTHHIMKVHQELVEHLGLFVNAVQASFGEPAAEQLAKEAVPEDQAPRVVPQAKLAPRPQATRLETQPLATTVVPQPRATSLMCPFCNMRSNLLKDVVQHMKATHVTLACPTCEQSCKNHEALYQHIRDKHRGKASLLKQKVHAVARCDSSLVAGPTCGQEFLAQARLQQHIKDKHSQVASQPEKARTQKTQQESPGPQGPASSLQHLSDMPVARSDHVSEVSDSGCNENFRPGEGLHPQAHHQPSLPMSQSARSGTPCLICLQMFNTNADRDAHIEAEHQTLGNGCEHGVSSEDVLTPSAPNLVQRAEVIDVQSRTFSNAGSNGSASGGPSYSDIVRKKPCTDFREKGQTFADIAASSLISMKEAEADPAAQPPLESLPFSQVEPPALACGPPRRHVRSLHSYIIKGGGGHQCSICSFTAKGYQLVSLHLTEVHKITVPVTGEPVASNTDNPADLPHACRKRDTRLTSAKASSKHATQKKCPSPRNLQSRAASVPNLARESGTLKCEMPNCTQTFTSTITQCQHMFDKHGILMTGNHVCRYCNKKIPTTMKYYQHEDAHRRFGHRKR